MGLPLSPGYKKKRSRPPKSCVLRRDATESINTSRLADADSTVVNLQGDQERGKEGLPPGLLVQTWLEERKVSKTCLPFSNLLKSPSQHQGLNIQEWGIQAAGRNGKP